MKAKELSGLSKAELLKKKSEISQELFEMKMKHSLGQLANALQIREKRRDLARVETSLSVQKGG
ncbi:MAG: 50S ribosomal protein L29 [Bdellovibrio sp.]